MLDCPMLSKGECRLPPAPSAVRRLSANAVARAHLTASASNMRRRACPASALHMLLSSERTSRTSVTSASAGHGYPVAGSTVLHEARPGWRVLAIRSEEHTSELQSLMRTSYAVFCLKKKKSHQSEL